MISQILNKYYYNRANIIILRAVEYNNVLCMNELLGIDAIVLFFILCGFEFYFPFVSIAIITR